MMNFEIGMALLAGIGLGALAAYVIISAIDLHHTITREENHRE